MQPFFAAISFLTILRIPPAWCADEQHTHENNIARSLIWFPLVGVVIGAIMVVLDLFLCAVFSTSAQPLVAGAIISGTVPGAILPSAILVIAMIAISGGLHLDGVADSADAFMSSRGKEQMLEIMHDSRVGAMGALAISCVLLLKFAVLISLPQQWRSTAIFLMPVAGRCALVVQTVSLPYARSNGGLASLMQQNSQPKQAVIAILSLTVMAIVISAITGGWFYAVTSGITISAACCLTIWLFCRYCYYKIGGFTGDTLGALCELTELIPPIALLASLNFFSHIANHVATRGGGL